jgi:hypothetical protein
MRTEPWPEPEKHQQGRQRNDGDHRGARHSEAHHAAFSWLFNATSAVAASKMLAFVRISDSRAR